MTTVYHINPDTGNPNVCRAKIECRYGVDKPHYPTKEAARIGYASEMSNKNIPEGLKQPVDNTANLVITDGLKHREMREKVRTIDANHVDELDYIVKNGDESVLREVAKNPNVTDTQLKIAISRSINEKTREYLRDHPNYTPEKWNRELIMKYTKDWVKQQKLVPLINNSGISSEGLEWISLNAGEHSGLNKTFLKTSNPNVTNEIRLRALKSPINHSLSKDVVESPGFKGSELEGEMTPYQRRDVATYSNDSETLGRLTSRVISEYGSKKTEWTDQTAIAIYKNPATSEMSRDGLVEYSPVVGSFDKLSRLQKHYPEAFKNLLLSSDNGGSSLYGSEKYYLNVNAVEDLGLDNGDIWVYMKHMKGVHLLSASYDKATGVYKGYKD